MGGDAYRVRPAAEGELPILMEIERAESNGRTAITLTTFRDIPWNAPYYERLGFRALDPEEFTPELRITWEEERQYGFPKGSRVCMRREV